MAPCNIHAISIHLLDILTKKTDLRLQDSIQLYIVNFSSSYYNFIFKMICSVISFFLCVRKFYGENHTLSVPLYIVFDVKNSTQMTKWKC